jgi:hypothetical protein
MRDIDMDTLQGYACWAVASALGILVMTIVVISIVRWVS